MLARSFAIIPGNTKNHLNSTITLTTDSTDNHSDLHSSAVDPRPSRENIPKKNNSVIRCVGDTIGDKNFEPSADKCCDCESTSIAIPQLHNRLVVSFGESKPLPLREIIRLRQLNFQGEHYIIKRLCDH